MAVDLESLVVQLSADFKSFEKSLARAQGVSNKQFNAIEQRARQMNKNLNGVFTRSFDGLKGPLAGIGAALSVNALVKYADQWSDLQARVGNAAGSMEAAPLVMERISEIARRTYSDLGQTAEAYIANAGTLRELGYSTQQVLDYTEALNNALVVSGAKGDRAASVMSALSKAMATGKLAGDNLNTVIESRGRVAEALAASMGKSTLELRKLGADGKITRKELFGITKELEKLRREAEGMPATVADAFGQLNNAVLQWVGGMDQASGMSANVATAILSVADNFGAVADAALQLATILTGALAGRAMGQLITSAGAGVTAIGALITALRAGTVTAASFNAALGPIGLTIGAVAAGVLLLSNRQNAAEAAAERFNGVIELNAEALDKAKDSSGKYTQALRDQIAMQLEAAKASEALANAEFEAANARAQAFAKMTGMKFSPFEYAADQALKEANAVSFAAGQIEDQLQRIDKAGVSKQVAPSDTSDKKKGSKKKTPAERFDGDMQQIVDRTAALVAETEAMRQLNPLIDDYGYAMEKARTEQELLNAAQKAGVAITPELRAQIAQTAEQWALATAEANKLAEAQDKIRQRAEEWRDTGQDATRGFVDDLMNGVSAAEALASALDKVLSKLLDMAFDDIFSGLFKGGGGFLGGILGRKDGGPIKAATGGLIRGPGGPRTDSIPAMLSDGEYVINAKATKQNRALLEAINSGRSLALADGGMASLRAPSMATLQAPSQARSAQAAPQININIASASGDDYIRSVVSDGVNQGLRQYDKSGPMRFARDSKQANRRGLVR